MPQAVVLCAVVARRRGVARSNNGPEFVAKDLRHWLAATGARTLYLEPGSPWENGISTPRSKPRGGPGYCESFHSKMRDEFLKGEIFYSIQELRVLAQTLQHYPAPLFAGLSTSST